MATAAGVSEVHALDYTSITFCSQLDFHYLTLSTRIHCQEPFQQGCYKGYSCRLAQDGHSGKLSSSTGTFSYYGFMLCPRNSCFGDKPGILDFCFCQTCFSWMPISHWTAGSNRPLFSFYGKQGWGRGSVATEGEYTFSVDSACVKEPRYICIKHKLEVDNRSTGGDVTIRRKEGTDIC